MRRSRISTGEAAAGVCVGIVVAALTGAALSAPPSRFGEAVVVREADVLSEPPPRLGAVGDPRSWSVIEDGLAREVVRVERLADLEGEPWDLIVWLDDDLAPAAVRLHATAALSRLAPDLARRGPVSLWRDGVESGVRGEASGIESLLADAALAGTTAGDTVEIAALDRLLLFVDRRPRSGPGVIALPAGPLAVEPAAVPMRLDEVARTLAAYGWTVLVLPLRAAADDLPTSLDDRSDYQRWRDEVATHGVDFRGIRWPPRRRRVSVERTATQLDPALQVWRRFVAPGGGWVVDSEQQLRLAFGQLAERRRLWYRTPAALDGAVRAIETRWQPTGQATRAQAWRRAGTPEVVVDARLRDVRQRGETLAAAQAALDLRAGRDGLPPPPWRSGERAVASGALRFEVSVPASGRISLRLGSEPPEAPGTGRLARVSCLDGDVVHHVVPWAATFEVACAAPRVVGLEDLATGAWGALLLR
jgi:hypothetical protein